MKDLISLDPECSVDWPMNKNGFSFTIRLSAAAFFLGGACVKPDVTVSTATASQMSHYDMKREKREKTRDPTEQEIV